MHGAARHSVKLRLSHSMYLTGIHAGLENSCRLHNVKNRL